MLGGQPSERARRTGRSEPATANAATIRATMSHSEFSHQWKAETPVSAWPMISWCTSLVPS
ncbi:hypothetical protein GCM10027415_32240 [Humibacter ginsengisoli]